MSWVACNIASALRLGYHFGFSSSHTTIKLVLGNSTENPILSSTLLSDFRSERAVFFLRIQVPIYLSIEIAITYTFSVGSVINHSNSSRYVRVRLLPDWSTVLSGYQNFPIDTFMSLKSLLKNLLFWSIFPKGSFSTGCFMFNFRGSQCPKVLVKVTFYQGHCLLSTTSRRCLVLLTTFVSVITGHNKERLSVLRAPLPPLHNLSGL